MKILPGADRWYVEGEIESAMGFEDEDMKIKDYGILLKNPWTLFYKEFESRKVLQDSAPDNVLSASCW